MKKRKEIFNTTKKFGDWNMFGSNIRFRRVTYVEPVLGDILNDYECQTYGAPYFFKLFRQRKWVTQITTNSLELGLEWCKHLLEAKRIPVPPQLTPVQQMREAIDQAATDGTLGNGVERMENNFNLYDGGRLKAPDHE